MKQNKLMIIKAEMNETENRTLTENINKIKSWFLEKFNKIEKPLVRVTKKRRRN